MASLASNLSRRAGSLADRSTAESLVPVGSALELGETPSLVGEPVAVSSITNRRPERTTTTPTTDHGGIIRPQSAERVTLPRPLAGPEGRLEASGETIVKWTLELAPQLVMALNVWERDETKRLGQRVFRERMIDLALDNLPEDLDSILTIVSGLPSRLRHTPGQQFGTRVRSSVRNKLLGLRPELRVAGVKNVRIRDIYSAAVYRYLIGLGIHVDQLPPASKN